MGLLLFIIIGAVPAYYINLFLLKIIQPRLSFGRFLLYIVSGFAMAFFYTFIFVWLTLKFV
ncbi:MAG: hypothetical protein H0U44_02540 [Flavisolibacter sp.]|jgi:uncharacterized RDD family membrane protein YckC|nr:hypothetical protein [Flavisolibacter sp.]